MNENVLIISEFFGLMNENLQKITNEQMQHAFEKFIADVETFSNVGNDLTNITES